VTFGTTSHGGGSGVGPQAGGPPNLETTVAPGLHVFHACLSWPNTPFFWGKAPVFRHPSVWVADSELTNLQGALTGLGGPTCALARGSSPLRDELEPQAGPAWDGSDWTRKPEVKLPEALRLADPTTFAVSAPWSCTRCGTSTT
jgi:hypothetical protein